MTKENFERVLVARLQARGAPGDEATTNFQYLLDCVERASREMNRAHEAGTQAEAGGDGAAVAAATAVWHACADARKLCVVYTGNVLVYAIFPDSPAAQGRGGCSCWTSWRGAGSRGGARGARWRASSWRSSGRRSRPTFWTRSWTPSSSTCTPR